MLLMFVLKVLGKCTKKCFFEKKIYVFQLTYKIRSKGKFPSAEARTNDGTGCRPTDDSINSTIFNLLDGSIELVSKELNHLAAILHVYAGGLIFMK